MRLHHRELERLASEILDVGTWLMAHARGLSERVAADTEDGVNGVDYAAVKRGSDGTPVERRALKGTHDPVAVKADRMLRLFREAAGELRLAKQSGGDLLALPATEASRLAAKQTIEGGVGPCVNCGHYCVGQAVNPETGEKTDDRLRRGRCNACRMWATRHDGEERPKSDFHDSPRPEFWRDVHAVGE